MVMVIQTIPHSHSPHRMELRYNPFYVCVPDHCESIEAASSQVVRRAEVHCDDVITVRRATFPGWL